MKYTKTQLLDKIERWPGGGLWAFAVQQAWAALFGGLMLGAIVFTHYVTLPGLAQYDWLFLFAIAIQLFMLATKLEKSHEVITIVCFHLVGLGMELFKTSGSIQSWTYPGHAFFHLGNVPLFSGFMYAAVGSYIARVWRITKLRFSHYPRRRYTVILAMAIYANFFTHHYIYDFRYVLFAALLVLYGRSWVSYTIRTKTRRMPVLLSGLLAAVFIWIGENIGTYTHTWLYPNQEHGWHLVSFDKVGSWLLLMVISFILVDLLHYVRAKLAARTIEDITA